MVARTPKCDWCGEDTRKDRRTALYADIGVREDKKNRMRVFVGYLCPKCSEKRLQINLEAVKVWEEVRA